VTPAASRWVGVALLGALLVHAVIDKLPRRKLAEMLFACHVFTVIMALGLLWRRPAPVLLGLTFHVGVGLSTFVFSAIALRTLAPTSLLVHLGPVAAGLWALRGQPAGALPAWTIPVSTAIFAAMLVLSWWRTPKALNVNQAHAPWPSLARRFPALWQWWSAMVSFTAVTVALAWLVLIRVLPRAS